MLEKTLFIKIFQPFAQYRNPFTFYYAQTYPLPPKSTVIGMLQNAVGDWYGNEYGIENWWNLKVSVHGGFESVFWNYQNLIKGEIELKKENEKLVLYNQGLPLYGEGITSQRSPVYQQELFNGHLYIFIKGEDELIEKIKKSLEKPTKVLYLGRSEDIVFIRNVKEITPKDKIPKEGEDIIRDITLIYPTYLSNDLPIANKKYPVYSIPIKVIFENKGKQVKHKAEITKETERKLEIKPVIYTGYDYQILLNEKDLSKKTVSIEIYEIENKEIKIFDNYGWL
ncbi:MAG: type I-B CRISPR-associated protein Cas5b [Candidatus Aenigmatarchaeota archaeon]